MYCCILHRIDFISREAMYVVLSLHHHRESKQSSLIIRETLVVVCIVTYIDYSTMYVILSLQHREKAVLSNNKRDMSSPTNNMRATMMFANNRFQAMRSEKREKGLCST